MNILLIGPGSIGRRHLKNLISLGHDDIAVISRKSNIHDEFPQCTFYHDLNEALKSEKFDASFICTPTSVHLKNLKTLLTNGIPNIYVEKPVSNSNKGLDEVVQLAKSSSSNIIAGYDLHFDPGYLKVKEWIHANTIGKIVSANAFVGQHLAQWRPQEDYRNGMSAKKETGGGVMLDLIHEVDYLCDLFGDVAFVASTYTNSGTLEIETEEVAEILLKFSGSVMATVHFDYLQPKLKRFCIFTGTTGTIHWDLAEQKVTTVFNDRQQEFSYASFQRNDRFVSIVKTFLESPHDEKLTTLPEAIKSLQVILAAKYASENSCVVKMNEWSMMNTERNIESTQMNRNTKTSSIKKTSNQKL